MNITAEERRLIYIALTLRIDTMEGYRIKNDAMKKRIKEYQAIADRVYEEGL